MGSDKARVSFDGDREDQHTETVVKTKAAHDVTTVSILSNHDHSEAGVFFAFQRRAKRNIDNLEASLCDHLEEVIWLF